MMFAVAAIQPADYSVGNSFPMSQKVANCADVTMLLTFRTKQEQMPKPERVRDPIHDLIQFKRSGLEACCWEVVKSRPFQRLRRIKQLGFSEMTFPGATHSRLAHSLGVFNTARQLTSVIRDLKETGFDSMAADAAIAAALVHDIGHGPFSHAFETATEMAGIGADHEDWTVRIIQETPVRDALEAVTPGFSSRVAKIIGSDGPADIYCSIVSSQFDADRLDYMRRDRLMTGSQHAAIDFTWLLANLEIGRVNVGQDDKFIREAETFVLGPKSVMAGEAYVLGLFQLYPTVYLHKATRGAECIFSALLTYVFRAIMSDDWKSTGLPENHPLVSFAKDPSSVENYLRLDDSVILGSLPLLQGGAISVVAEFATRLLDRKLFQCCDVTKKAAAWAHSRMPDDKDIEKRRELARTAEAKVRELVRERGLADLPSGGPIMLKDDAERNPYKQMNAAAAALNRIWVKGEDGALHDLGQLSDVVKSLVPFRAYRLYYGNDSGREAVDGLLREAFT
jgi:HD superfamily phosphohydrolase